MKRIDTLTAVANKFGAGKNGFTDGDPTVGLDATDLEAKWFDQAQESLIRVIEAAGETPSDDLDQFTRCVNKLIESRVGDYALDTGSVNAPVVVMNPAVTSYVNGMEVSFRLKFGNTDAVLLNAGAGARPLVRDDGVALIPGDLPVNVLVNAFYDQPSNKFIINSLVTSQALSKAAADALYDPLGKGSAVQCAFKNLVSSSGGLNAVVLESVEEITLENSSNLYLTLRNLFLTGNMAASGANGIDTGVAAANSWYSKWIIHNPIAPASAIIFALAPVLTGNTTSGSGVVTALASTASMRIGMPLSGANFPVGTVIKTVDSGTQITASQPSFATTTGTSITFVYDPVMPSGYTYKARTGFVRTDGTANKFPLSFTQIGKNYRVKVASGSNVSGLPAMASGAQGSVSTPTYVAVAIGSFVPPTATSILIAVGNLGSTGGAAMAAPSNNYGAITSSTNQPPYVNCQGTGASAQSSIPFDMTLESASNIYIATNAFAFLCLGHTDNI